MDTKQRTTKENFYVDSLLSGKHFTRTTSDFLLDVCTSIFVILNWKNKERYTTMRQKVARVHRA